MADRGEAPSDFVPDDAAGDDTARGRGGMPGGPFRRGGPLSEREREDIEFLKNYKVAIGGTEGWAGFGRRAGGLGGGARGKQAPWLTLVKRARTHGAQPTPEDVKLMRECSERVISDSTRSCPPPRPNPPPPP